MFEEKCSQSHFEVEVEIDWTPLILQTLSFPEISTYELSSTKIFKITFLQLGIKLIFDFFYEDLATMCVKVARFENTIEGSLPYIHFRVNNYTVRPLFVCTWLSLSNPSIN